ncbi:hypothetical protein [Anaerobaca lacustris]|uniref:Uncharacterized protein n=1 Tax=Anaerobaca lacustris TaxID=3044600 RepID=A0AAW6TVI0_9BACT|nr:hypothetical protein [Sedimentisphaerales bacterium M17dextr]
MAKRQRTGWKAYIPTLRGGVQIFVALVAIKIVLSLAGSAGITSKIPGSVAQYFPNV